MKLKDALGLSSSDRHQPLPISVWLPVSVVAIALAIAVLWALDISNGLVTFLIIAVAAGLVMPVSALISRSKGSRTT
ncbi:hypothetical protein [Modestobacter sp. SYSU DS0875]